jgi:3-oxoadipate enol-lactonase
LINGNVFDKRKIKMPKAKVGEINLYYEIHGKGEPLVYIGGFGTTTEALKGRIAPFTKDYRVIIYDTRGSGRSDVPDITYTPAMMAGDLAGLLEAIGIKAARICGESFGGYIAQHFALGYPQKVISLVLRCTSCGGPHSPPRDPEYVKLNAAGGLANLSAPERNKLMLPFLITPGYIASHPGIEEIFTPKTPVKYPVTPAGYKKLAAVTAAHDTYDRLPRIKAPTLVVHGDADRILDVENARILAARIPGAELIIFKVAGHTLAEVNNECDKTILGFLRKHDG